jgi:mono/diheme cytochrome c family protein
MLSNNDGRSELMQSARRNERKDKSVTRRPREMQNKKLGAVVVAFSILSAMAWGAITTRGQNAKVSKSEPTGDTAEGDQIFQDRCEICHFSTTTKKKIGPGLAGLMKREKFQNGMKADEKDLRLVIERGGKDMPGFRGAINDVQIRDLIAYLQTL